MFISPSNQSSFSTAFIEYVRAEQENKIVYAMRHLFGAIATTASALSIVGIPLSIRLIKEFALQEADQKIARILTRNTNASYKDLDIVPEAGWIQTNPIEKRKVNQYVIYAKEVDTGRVLDLRITKRRNTWEIDHSAFRKQDHQVDWRALRQMIQGIIQIIGCLKRIPKPLFS